MIVQIYEIQSPEEASRCVDMGVDHVGCVILAQAEWRQPDLKEVVRMTAGTSAKSSMIPLFRDREALLRVVDYYRPDFIHLCDALAEGPHMERDIDGAVSLQAKLKEHAPEVGIIRTLPVPVRGSAARVPVLEMAGPLEPVTDFFLVDTWVPEAPVQGFLGITGEPCDWSAAKALVARSAVPVILAGGLSPDNVYEALSLVAPAGADSCTHTNMQGRAGRPIRFKKDFDRVGRFVQEARRAEEALASRHGQGHGKKG